MPVLVIPALRKLFNCGAIEAIFRTDIIEVKDKLEMIAGIAGTHYRMRNGRLKSTIY
jgi:hypothetical protein